MDDRFELLVDRSFIGFVWKHKSEDVTELMRKSQEFAHIATFTFEYVLPNLAWILPLLRELHKPENREKRAILRDTAFGREIDLQNYEADDVVKILREWEPTQKEDEG